MSATDACAAFFMLKNQKAVFRLVSRHDVDGTSSTNRLKATAQGPSLESLAMILSRESHVACTYDMEGHITKAP